MEHKLCMDDRGLIYRYTYADFVNIGIAQPMNDNPKGDFDVHAEFFFFCPVRLLTEAAA
jgi:hypothetical protein